MKMIRLNFFIYSVLPLIIAIMAISIVIQIKSEIILDDASLTFEHFLTEVKADAPLLTQLSNHQSGYYEKLEQDLLLINWIAIFAIAIVFFSGIIFSIHQRSNADQKLKELTRRTLEFQEEERARVSRELHDGISQILVSVKYSIELAVDKIKTNSQDAIDQIEKGTDSLHDAISEVRRISRDLRPTVLDDLGLSEALDTLCQDFSGRTGIDVSFKGVNSCHSLSKNAQTDLYRIAQEALTNIERHAQATIVSIIFDKSSTAYKLVIEDNGRGFQIPKYSPFSPTSLGLGLKNMMERVAYHDGEIIFNSDGQNGTQIEIKIPLTMEKAA